MNISPPAKGWHVELDLPSGETAQTEVAGTPSRNPAVNDYPRLDIPVRKREMWQNLDLKNNTVPVRVWYNARRQPIDELEDIEETEGATQVLKGRGGTELDQRVETQVDLQEAHLLAKDLIENNTTYTANVDTPQTTTETDVPVQAPDTLEEWRTALEREKEPRLPITVVGNVIYFIQSDRRGHCGILAGHCSFVSAPTSAFLSVS
jgi:hypothetical protein